MTRRKSIEDRAREAVAEWGSYVEWRAERGHETSPTDDALTFAIHAAIYKAIAADRRKRGERR